MLLRDKSVGDIVRLTILSQSPYIQFIQSAQRSVHPLSPNLPSQPPPPPQKSLSAFQPDGERQAYLKGYIDGYKMGAFSQPPASLITGQVDQLQANFPNAYQKGQNDGLTAAGNAIQSHNILGGLTKGVPGSAPSNNPDFGSFNPNALSDPCFANPSTEAQCEKQRRYQQQQEQDQQSMP